MGGDVNADAHSVSGLERKLKRSRNEFRDSIGKTRSRRLQDAIRQAEKIPGFSKPEGAGVEMVIEIRVPFEDSKVWHRIQELRYPLGRWKSTVVLLDGKEIEPGQLSSDLSQVVACYRSKQSSDPLLHYCSGRDRPNGDISAFGCRLIKGVDLRDWGGSEMHWYEFGALSADQKRFAVDKDAILGRLRHKTIDKACVSCPAFSWTHVAEAVQSLPGEIDLERSSRFR